MPSFPFTMPQLMNLTPLAASGNSNPISLPPKSIDMSVTLQVKFTLGSLTNAAVFVQVLHVDGTTWLDLITTGTTVLGTGTMSANSSLALALKASGIKQVRCRYTSSGTVTSSALVIDATVQQG